jgi:hypothetical protein
MENQTFKAGLARDSIVFDKSKILKLRRVLVVYL